MRNIVAALLAALMLLPLLGCEAPEEPTETTLAPTTAEETLPLPPDGDPGDVTCKGTYTVPGRMDQVVAQSGGGKLTNGELQAWYWTAVASWQTREYVQKPDLSLPLEAQPCPVDDSVNSWQQFFLKQALNNWHRSQALYAQGQEKGLPVEEAFQPVDTLRGDNLVGIPAVKYLYREEKAFQPNTLHQAYLDNMMQRLEELAREKGYQDAAALAGACGTTPEDLAEMARRYNQGYMYYTNLSYFLEVSDEEMESWFRENEQEYAALGLTWDSGAKVDFRQILLVPEESGDHPGLTVEVAEDGTVTCPEELWEETLKEAKTLIQKWRGNGRPWSEGAFSELAYLHSGDASSVDGGLYSQVEQGQMIPVLDDWLFAEERKVKDYEILRSEYGYHILYLTKIRDLWALRAEEDLMAKKLGQLVLDAVEACPMTVAYSDIVLQEGAGVLAMEELLYQDVAHERFPEVPVYLQQDYPKTMYGAYQIRTHGCGITSLAMLASYMTDEEWTPPELCAMYGRYNTEEGTDVTLFKYEPPAMGFYDWVVYKDEDALQALKDGYILISLQREGYWTGGGHYIVVEKLHEDGTVQVRDSNVFNYGKLEGHKTDSHAWEDVTRANKVFWAFEKKLTAIPTCSRCGDCQGVADSLLQTGYLCRKCRPALLRRDTYLSLVG